MSGGLCAIGKGIVLPRPPQSINTRETGAPGFHRAVTGSNPNAVEKGWSLQPDTLQGLKSEQLVGELVRHGQGTRPKDTRTGVCVKCSSLLTPSQGLPILRAQEWAEEKQPSLGQDPILQTSAKPHLF